MKKQNGVTLVSLILYIAIMIIVLGMMTTITTSFYKNTTNLEWDVQQIVEFNKFNIYFLKEIKTNNNAVDKYESNNYILFKTGNSFSIANNAIYYNSIKICNDVKSMEITLVNPTVINVKLEFENYSKSMNYKIENIY